MGPLEHIASAARRRLQWWVIAALLPGVVVLAAAWPTGVIANLLIASVVGLTTEAFCLRLRGHDIGSRLADGSAVLTSVLIALALPPGCSAIVITAAVVIGLGIGKHAYGGLGQNLFNPAMVGYAAVLVSFPAALATWPPLVDGSTGATVLSSLTNERSVTLTELASGDFGFGRFGGALVEWAAVAFAIGGLALALLKLLAWRVSAGMLLALAIGGFFGYDGGSSGSLGSPMLHLFSGGTLLAAFFVLTDPVTHPADRRGQWLFGLFVGAMTFVIRSWAAYPDGIAFAVLLGNSLTPWLARTLANPNRREARR